jgi:hypothetical protein
MENELFEKQRKTWNNDVDAQTPIINRIKIKKQNPKRNPPEEKITVYQTVAITKRKKNERYL